MCFFSKAKPNYRRTATDLAGMLTITEEAAGRGSLGKVTAGRELHMSGPQGQGRGGTLFQDLLLSLFIIVEVSARRSNLQLTTHIDANGQKLSNRTPTPPMPSHPEPSTDFSKHQTKQAHNSISLILVIQHCHNCSYNALVSTNVTSSMSRVTQKAYYSLQG